MSKTFESSDPFLLPLDWTPQSLGESGRLPVPTSSVAFNEFTPRPGNLTLPLGAAGVKFNPAGNRLVSGSVLFPLTDAGLRSRVTTTIGLDYAF